MSRLRIEMNKNFFGKIEGLLLGFDETFLFSPAVRFVGFGGDDRERQFAANAKVLASYDFLHGNALFAEEKSGDLLLIVGSDRYVWNASAQRASPAEFLLFYDHFPVRLAATPKSVFDVASLIDVDEYTGHDPEDLYPLFKPVMTFRSADIGICRSKLLGDTLARVAKDESQVDAELSDRYLDFDYRACRYELAKLASIAALGHRSQFLELYTILESMFFDIYCEEIYDSIGVEVDKEHLFFLLEKTIGWRPKEVEALQKLVVIALANDTSAGDEICDLLEMNSTRPEKIAASIYGFRNNYVHWRLKRIDPNLNELNKYSKACLVLLSAIPSKYFHVDGECECSGKIQVS